MVLDDEGEVVSLGARFEEALLIVEVDPFEAVAGRCLRDVPIAGDIRASGQPGV